MTKTPTSPLNLANLLTLGRILCVPVFVVMLLRNRPEEARLGLWIFIGASLTDVIDGLVARTFHLESKLGALLDPLADKLLLVAAYACFWHLHLFPTWFLVLVFARELVVGVGALVARRLGAVSRQGPTRLGKYSTFSQLLTLTLALLYKANGGVVLLDYMRVAMTAATVTTLLSATQYIVLSVSGLRSAHQGTA